MRLNILSCGAGVQSTTLALLACSGDLPGLDAAIFADTGWEPAQVYRQVDRIEAELAKVGIPLHRVSKGNLRADSIDPTRRFASVPYFVRNPDGSDGMGRRQCTAEYKLGPIMRKCRELLGAAPPDFRRVPKGNTVVQWIGFSTDEIHRVDNKRANLYSEKRYPLLELGMSRKDCQRYLERAGWGDTAKSACIGCFAYETEVITETGRRPIGELVGPDGVGRANLLIPRRQSGWSSWREVEVRSFGVQQLCRIELVRRRETKVVHATAEHRWRTRDRKTGVWSEFITTADLKPGDVLPVSRAQTIAATGPNRPVMSRIGVAAGAVFGDGSAITRRRTPAQINLYDGKDEPLLPYFDGFTQTHREAPAGANKGYTFVYGLPRTWKAAPDLDESRGYLLGWLAGYFAADGSVTKKGQAVLSSATREHLQLAQTVADILGVRTTAIRTKEHPAKGGMSTLHELGITVRDLPTEFWIMPHHAERVAAAVTKGARDDGWKVKSISATDRVEEVFCAVVPGEEMFVIAENLATGNCPFHGNAQWRELRDNHPEEWADAVDFDRAIRKGGARGLPLRGEAFLHRSRLPLDQAPIDRVTPKEWADRQLDIYDVLESGDPDGCSPYGCRSGEAVTLDERDVS